MISFIKKQFASLRQTVFDNSLFYYRWQRFSIYTWFNLVVFLTVSLFLLCTIVRFIHYLEARSLLVKIPDYQHEIMAVLFAEQWEFALFPGTLEVIWLFVQYGAFSLLYVLFLISTARDLWLWHKRRWDHPSSDHIRLLPVSAGQAQFALVDLRFCVMSSCILFCTLLLLLPALDLRSYLQYLFSIDLKLNKYALNTIWLWVMIFAGYRTVQFQQHHGLNIIANPMFGRWLIAFFFWIAFTMILLRIAGAIIGEVPESLNNAEFFLSIYALTSHYSAIVSCLILFLSCWTLKHHLHQQPEE